MPYEAPLYVNVLIPTEKREQGHGIHSTAHIEAKRYTTRFNPEEKDVIEEMSALLGMEPSSFLRQVTVNAARKLKDHYDAYLKSDRSG